MNEDCVKGVMKNAYLLIFLPPVFHLAQAAPTVYWDRRPWQRQCLVLG